MVTSVKSGGGVTRARVRTTLSDAQAETAGSDEGLRGPAPDAGHWGQSAEPGPPRIAQADI